MDEDSYKIAAGIFMIASLVCLVAGSWLLGGLGIALLVLGVCLLFLVVLLSIEL